MRLNCLKTRHANNDSFCPKTRNDDNKTKCLIIRQKAR